MTSVVRRQEQEDSGEYSDASQENEQNNSRNDAANPESDYDSNGSEDSDLSERENTNSQDTERRVDDDEDRSNPQYIPKRGTFYEHDDRTAAGGEDTITLSTEGAPTEKEGGQGAGEPPAERRRPPRKSDICNKWSHDKYNENEQMPKSRDELMAVYGYDIRNEEAPPHARRNRRYGRGPNKYTRTWEDEEAYKRQANAAPNHNRKPPNPEDFPELEKSIKKVSKKGRPPRSKSQPNNSNESLENGNQLRRNASIKTPANQKQNLANRNVTMKQSVGNKHNVSLNKSITKQNTSTSVSEKMPPLENLTITASVNNASQTQRKVNAPTGQQRPVPTLTAQTSPSVQPPKRITTSQQITSNRPSQIQTPIQQQQQQQHKPQQQQQQALAPQQQSGTNENRGGSKRYSSLRQRPLAETYSPQPQHRYVPEYQQSPPAVTQHQGSPVAQMHPQSQLIHQVVRTTVGSAQHGPSPPHQPLPQPQLQPQQLPQQQLPQQQLPPQQLPPQQLPPQQLPQQQLQKPQLPQQQLQQPQHTPPQLQQPQLPPPQHPQAQHSQQVRLNMLEQQQLVPHSHSHTHPMHSIPQPHSLVSGQLPPTQGYAPPAMMPAQYMQGGNNAAAVYAGAPMYAQPPAPYPHQMFQHHNYATASGVTYYSPAEQEQQPRAQRRPTAAIPIVRPTQDRQANSSEKDNIDRIVENMFVRKPWPTTHGSDSSKEKSQENRNSQETTSKESSQSNSLTSSYISTESRPSTERTEPKDQEKQPEDQKESVEPIESTRKSEDREVICTEVEQKLEESIPNDA